MNLFINPNLSPRGALVISQLNPTGIPVRDFVFGNVLATNIYLVNGLGGYDANSGNETYSVRAGIGIPGKELDWVNTAWTAIPNGWSGLIATNSLSFQTLFSSLAVNPINCELEITIFDSLGEPVTDLSTPIKIWNRVAADDALIIPPSPNNTDGAFSIPSGVDTFLVTGLGLSAVPRSVQVGMRKAAGELNIFASVVSGTITTDGFRVDLSGVTDSTHYSLYYFLFF